MLAALYFLQIIQSIILSLKKQEKNIYLNTQQKYMGGLLKKSIKKLEMEQQQKAKSLVLIMYIKKCLAKKFLHRNTILEMKDESLNMRGIKMILQKNDLQISKIRRIKLGPFTKGVLQNGEIFEIEPDRTIRREFLENRRQKILESKVNFAQNVEKLQDYKSQDQNLLEKNRETLKQQLLVKLQKEKLLEQ